MALGEIRISTRTGLIAGGVLLLIFVATIFYNSVSLAIGIVTIFTGITGVISLTVSIAKMYMKKCVFYEAGFCELSKCPVWGSEKVLPPLLVGDDLVQVDE